MHLGCPSMLWFYSSIPTTYVPLYPCFVAWVEGNLQLEIHVKPKVRINKVPTVSEQNYSTGQILSLTEKLSPFTHLDLDCRH